MKTIYSALLTADWQLCNSLPYARMSGVEGVTDRLIHQLDVVRKIGVIAEERKVDGIFFLGDLFERSLLDAVTLRYGVEAVLLLAERFNVYVLAGNHDTSGARSKRFLPEVFDVLGHKRVRYLDQSSMVMIKDIAFFSLPWCSLDEAERELERLRQRRDECDAKQKVLLLHHSILDCTDGSWKCDVGLDPVEVCKGWDLVRAGHFHERQPFGTCGAYVGAPMQHDQRDANSDIERGVEIVRFTAESFGSSFYAIESPRFYTVDWGAGMTHHKLKRGDYVRMGVEATHAEWVATSAEAESDANELRDKGVHVDVFHKPVYQNEERLELSDAPSHNEVLSKYVESADTEGLDEKRLLEIGVQTLSEVMS